jgi:hypothetical protein
MNTAAGHKCYLAGSGNNSIFMSAAELCCEFRILSIGADPVQANRQ